MEKEKLTGHLTLNSVSSCLRLIDMDMTGVQLNITKSGTGTAVCGNGQKSEIRGNKGLWGELGEGREVFCRSEGCYHPVLLFMQYVASNFPSRLDNF